MFFIKIKKTRVSGFMLKLRIFMKSIQEEKLCQNKVDISNDDIGNNQDIDENEDKEEILNNKQTMMQNMAQLWLQQEVKDLEKGSRVSHRTYVIVDHWALVSHLNLVKDVVDSRRYVVIIPSTTIQQLDDMNVLVVMVEGWHNVDNHFVEVLFSLPDYL